MRLISATDIDRLLPMSRAIELMRDAYLAISRDAAALAPRQPLPMGDSTGLLMGAGMAGMGLACKLVAICPGNRAHGLPGSVGLVLLLDEATGEPRALLDGTALTALRTAALNGCAIDLLARADARIALLVGCGTQAASQAVAMAAVRPWQELRVLGRDPARAARFARRLQQELVFPVRVVDDAVEGLRGVDLVTAATSSLVPVLNGADVPAGCHVSGIGSYRPDMREFDRLLVERADVFVEARETASLEAGELMAAVEAGATAPASWCEIGEVLAGDRPGRTRDDQLTFFKSVGHPVFDLFAANAIHRAAIEQDVGLHWRP